QDVAEDDLIDLLWIDLRALERRLRRDHAEVGRRGVAQRAAERSERRARAIDDDYVFHWCSRSRNAAHLNCRTPPTCYSCVLTRTALAAAGIGVNHCAVSVSGTSANAITAAARYRIGMPA